MQSQYIRVGSNSEYKLYCASTMAAVTTRFNMHKLYKPFSCIDLFPIYSKTNLQYLTKNEIIKYAFQASRSERRMNV